MNEHLRETADRYDLVIIGAGIYGIQVARTYLELHPCRRLVLLEASGNVGGVWSRERVYDAFWTQTPLGILEFSDQPMHSIASSDQFHGFFKASHVTSYLENYCEVHSYSGASLASRIRTQTEVLKVCKVEGTWYIQTDSRIYAARQLVDASGLTSIPKWPKLPGGEVFRGQILHHKDFAKFQSNLKVQSPINIVVIGGAKSAADVVYASATTKQKVTWLIRRSGSGPAAFVEAKGSLGYSNSNESFYTRVTSLFLVSLFAYYGPYAYILAWLHKNFIGRKIVRKIWQRVDSKTRKQADYRRPCGRANGFYNLEPDTELFWQNDSTGINQHKDFFDIVAKRVNVIREDVSNFNESGVVLENGSCINADAVVCATGWEIAHPYFDNYTASILGLPTLPASRDTTSDSEWNDLQKSADAKIRSCFPILDGEWAQSQNTSLVLPDETQLPFRLWKSMVPPQDPSIIFMGKIMLGNHFRSSETQALFACAVLDGAISLPSKSDMKTEIAHTIAWCKRRYLQKGQLGNWFYWDMVPYTDMLLADLGLNSHRSTSIWKDLFRPCFASDLSGLIDEYREKTNTKR